MAEPDSSSPVDGPDHVADAVDELPVPDGPGGYGVFDLDHTLLPFDTQMLFCNHVLRQHWWRRFYLLIFLPLAPFAVIRIFSSRTMKRVFLSYLWGMKGETVREHARSFAEETVASSAYPAMVKRIEEFHAKGYATVLNTASPQFYAEEIARVFGMQHCYGTRVVVPENGRMPLFPKITGPNNKNSAKLKAMEELFPEEFDDYPRHRLPFSHGFTDSENDIPLLHCCEHGSLVNPDDIFRQEGELRAWKPIWPERPYKGGLGDLTFRIRQALGFYKPRPATSWMKVRRRRSRH